MTDPWQGREGVEMVPLGANKAQRLSADEVLVVASGLVHLFWQPDRNIRRTTYISRSAGEAFLGLREEGLVEPELSGELLVAFLRIFRSQHDLDGIARRQLQKSEAGHRDEEQNDKRLRDLSQCLS